MEKRRKPPHAAAPCRFPAENCACGQGYIVERVLYSRRCDTCFEGNLLVQGLPRGLCGPLRLCSVEVQRIDAVQSCDIPAGLPRRDPCAACGAHGRVMLTLLCCVEDACGCRAEGNACIEVEDCCAAGRPQPAGVTLRRGAQLRLVRAHFLPPCGFCVCMDICLHEIASRCELVSGTPKPNALPCPQLPLYPQPRHGR